LSAKDFAAGTPGEAVRYASTNSEGRTMMRKTLFAIATLAVFAPGLAMAQGEGTAAGAVTGGVAGAIVGGPVGAVVGAGVGATAGAATEAANKPDTVIVEPRSTSSVRERTCVRDAAGVSQCSETEIRR
jgi:hypothetical protein